MWMLAACGETHEGVDGTADSSHAMMASGADSDDLDSLDPDAEAPYIDLGAILEEEQQAI